jgi:3-oxoadipate enol-lactonase
VIPPTAWETREAQAGLYRGGAELLAARGLDRYLEAVLQAPESTWSQRELAGSRDQRVARMRTMGGLLTVLRASADSNFPPPDALAELGMPALVLAWEDDPVHPLETAHRLTELLPTTELHIARNRSEVLGWRAVVEAFLGRL